MELNFDSTKMTSDFVSVPAGTYVCEITEVRDGQTRNGDPRWSLKLTVAEGEYAGRLAAWDSLVLSPRGLARVRKVLIALGMPHQGRVELDLSDLQNRRALVEVRPAEWVTPTGESVRRNEVPYDGYRAMPENENDADGEDENEAQDNAALPF